MGAEGNCYRWEGRGDSGVMGRDTGGVNDNRKKWIERVEKVMGGRMEFKPETEIPPLSREYDIIFDQGS